MLCLSGLELYSRWLVPNIVGNETNNHFRPCFGLRRLPVAFTFLVSASVSLLLFMTSPGFSRSLRVLVPLLVTSVVSLVFFVSFRTLVSFYCFGFKYMLDEALVPRYEFRIEVFFNPSNFSKKERIALQLIHL